MNACVKGIWMSVCPSGRWVCRLTGGIWTTVRNDGSAAEVLPDGLLLKCNAVYEKWLPGPLCPIRWPNGKRSQGSHIQWCTSPIEMLLSWLNSACASCITSLLPGCWFNTVKVSLCDKVQMRQRENSQYWSDCCGRQASSSSEWEHKLPVNTDLIKPFAENYVVVHINVFSVEFHNMPEYLRN